MTIGMHFVRKIFAEIFPAVVRNEQRHSENVNPLIVSRIDPNLAEIKRPRIDVAHPGPFFATIIRPKDTAAPAVNVADIARATLIAWPHRHDRLRFTGRDRQPDSSRKTGQSATAFFPGRAAIGAFENSADVIAIGSGYAVGKRPRRPLASVEG